MAVGKVIYEAYRNPQIRAILTSGIASVVTTMKDGSWVETGMWATEGVVE